MNNTSKSETGRAVQSGRSYPSTPQIKRVVGAIRSAGIRVGSVSISLDGTVRVFDREASFDALRETDEFTLWDRAGKL